MVVNISSLIIKRDLKIVKPLYESLKEKMEALIIPLEDPSDIFETEEYNALIFNHFPVEADLFGSSQNFYYSLYNLEYFIINTTALLENHIDFETISFDPVTLICIAKFKSLVNN